MMVETGGTRNQLLGRRVSPPMGLLLEGMFKAMV
jgi:hypothetical protein